MKKFEVGKIYKSKDLSNNSDVKVKIVGRTEKTVKYVFLDSAKKEVKASRTFVIKNVEGLNLGLKYEVVYAK